MCGRYTVNSAGAAIAEEFGVDAAETASLAPRWNVAPSQPAPIVRVDDAGTRHLVLLRWGLIPSARPDAAPMINARAESVAERGAFAWPLRRHRCLVVADGFYEWRREGRARLPHYIRRRDGRPFAMAGVWDRADVGGAPVESFTIITADANDLVRPLHDRMPVVVPPDAYARWLDPSLRDPAPLRALLAPPPPEAWERFAVSPLVNSPANDVPECVAPLHT